MKRRKGFSSRKTIRERKGKGHQPSFVCPAFLLPEERIIFKTNPHWLFVVAPEVALLLVGLLILKYMPPLLPEEIPSSRWLLVLLGAALGFAMVVVFLHWICIKYYLTNLRLIEERGIIGKRIMSIWLDKVQDVTCKFGILGKIFGFGDIEIESAGTYGKIVCGFVSCPRKLREEVEQAILDFRQHSAGV
jgi:uncharacterized membrane protein YdbT with pleckstrin-like domain